jgi:NTE family protein
MPDLRLSLALQGGGAHGAFTWGVLDRLLEEPGFRPAGLSGASAGALNAVLLAAGWIEGGASAARERLRDFWRRIADDAAHLTLLPLGVGSFALGLTAHLLSPYQLAPNGRHPLGPVLADLVDMAALRKARFPLLIAATSARTGASRVFTAAELSYDAILASATLPQIHHAAIIDGEPFWDGGYTLNPPVLALAAVCTSRELLLVRINRLESDALPRDAGSIRDRVAEVVFGQPLARELELLAEARRKSRLLRLLDAETRRLAATRLHIIDGDSALAPLHPETKVLPGWPLLEQLRDAGRDAAASWLGTGRQPLHDAVPHRRYARPILMADRRKRPPQPAPAG